MSAEGKKKRGVAGMSHANNIAFRNGGSKCNLSTAIGSPRHPRKAGALFLSAMALGARLPGFAPSDTMLLAADACMDWCTVERPV